MNPVRCLLVGVRGHGGEEVYSTGLRDHPPAGVQISATFDFHHSCAAAHCHALAEKALNRVVYPWLAFDLGFRVLSLADDVDLVHVHSHPTVLRKRRGRPVVFSAGSSHYHYVRDYERWSPELIRTRYARASAVYPRLGVVDGLLNPGAMTLAYTFSHEARAVYLAFGVPAEKIRVLYPGFEVPPEPRSREGGAVFLFMGRDPRRKGGDAVLAAFRELHAQRPETQLLFVTDEQPRDPGPGVEALSLVPPAEVGALYARADVFVNPTRAEGFGFTNAEAQGHGVPVISSRLGAIPEVVEDGRTGVLVAPDDPPALLAAMRRMAAEPAWRRDLGAAGRERFLRLFARPVFQRELRALYDEALQRAERA